MKQLIFRIRMTMGEVIIALGYWVAGPSLFAAHVAGIIATERRFQEMQKQYKDGEASFLKSMENVINFVAYK